MIGRTTVALGLAVVFLAGCFSMQDGRGQAVELILGEGCVAVFPDPAIRDYVCVGGICGLVSASDAGVLHPVLSELARHGISYTFGDGGLGVTDFYVEPARARHAIEIMRRHTRARHPKWGAIVFDPPHSVYRHRILGGGYAASHGPAVNDHVCVGGIRGLHRISRLGAMHPALAELSRRGIAYTFGTCGPEATDVYVAPSQARQAADALRLFVVNAKPEWGATLRDPPYPTYAERERAPAPKDHARECWVCPARDRSESALTEP